MKIFRGNPSFPTHSVRRILVRCPNWIGDAVMATPALSAIRDLFPRAEVTALAIPSVSELLRRHPAIDHHMVFQRTSGHGGIKGIWEVSRLLRLQSFDGAILFPNAFEAAWLMYLAGIPHRYGYATDARRMLLTHPVQTPAKTLHQVDYYVNLLTPLGNPLPPVRPMLRVAEAERQWADQALTEAGIESDDCVLALNPGSMYGTAKRWFPERFAEAADRLVDRLETESPSSRRGHTLIIGARGEEPIARRIAERMRTRAVIMTGRTSIRELMAILTRCHLLLTNDTGPMHVAAALDVPIVSVFGPTDPSTTAPYGLPGSVVRQPVDCSPCLKRECPLDHRCMTSLSVEHVVEVALRQLSKSRRLSGFHGTCRITCSPRVTRDRSASSAHLSGQAGGSSHRSRNA